MKQLLLTFLCLSALKPQGANVEFLDPEVFHFASEKVFTKKSDEKHFVGLLELLGREFGLETKMAETSDRKGLVLTRALERLKVEGVASARLTLEKFLRILSDSPVVGMHPEQCFLCAQNLKFFLSHEPALTNLIKCRAFIGQKPGGSIIKWAIFLCLIPSAIFGTKLIKKRLKKFMHPEPKPEPEPPPPPPKTNCGVGAQVTALEDRCNKFDLVLCELEQKINTACEFVNRLSTKELEGQIQSLEAEVAALGKFCSETRGRLDAELKATMEFELSKINAELKKLRDELELAKAALEREKNNLEQARAALGTEKSNLELEKERLNIGLGQVPECQAKLGLLNQQITNLSGQIDALIARGQPG